MVAYSIHLLVDVHIEIYFVFQLSANTVKESKEPNETCYVVIVFKKSEEKTSKKAQSEAINFLKQKKTLEVFIQ